MKLRRIRKYKKRLRKSLWVVKGNPVIALGLALPFVIVPTLTLQNGVAISFLMAVATVPTALISCAIGTRLPAWVKVPLLAFCSMVLVLLGCRALQPFPAVLEGLGIYAPLTAVNSMLLELVSVHPRNSFKTAFRDSLRMCIGFAIVACSVAALREIFGSRTLWGQEFGVFPIRMQGITMPFFGFIALGFLSAFFKNIDRMFSRCLLRRDLDDAAREEIKSHG